MSPASNPSVRRRVLASELRRLRAAAGLTQAEAERAAGLGESSLSKYETGATSLSVVAAQRLLELYRVPAARIEPLLDLARAARRRGGLKRVRGVVWPPMEDLVVFERDATLLRELALTVVPDLLQTEDYARAVLAASTLEDDVERYVWATTTRAVEFLEREPAPEYQVVLRESALHCEVGGPRVLHHQLDHLLAISESPGVSLQVIPDSAGAHPSMGTGFRILSFDIARDFQVVYLDHLTGALYRDDPADVAPFEAAFDHLQKMALPPERSADLISKLRDRHLSAE